MSKALNRPMLVIGFILVAVAVVTAWDASTMRIRANYGVGANAASYLVAAFFVVLALGHFVAAVRQAEGALDDPDWHAVGWVALALAGLIGSIWLGGGFIFGATLLFALTARAFGRRALFVDLGIGLILGLLVYGLFHGLLGLTLPAGPLEYWI